MTCAIVTVDYLHWSTPMVVVNGIDITIDIVITDTHLLCTLPVGVYGTNMDYHTACIIDRPSSTPPVPADGLGLANYIAATVWRRSTTTVVLVNGIIMVITVAERTSLTHTSFFCIHKTETG